MSNPEPARLKRLWVPRRSAPLSVAHQALLGLEGDLSCQLHLPKGLSSTKSESKAFSPEGARPVLHFLVPLLERSWPDIQPSVVQKKTMHKLNTCTTLAREKAIHAQYVSRVYEHKMYRWTLHIFSSPGPVRSFCRLPPHGTGISVQSAVEGSETEAFSASSSSSPSPRLYLSVTLELNLHRWSMPDVNAVIKKLGNTL